MTRRAASVLAALMLAVMAVLATATAASAHATVVSTSPADGAIIAKAPATVSVTYDEAVGISADSLRVFAPDGKRADTGQTTHGRAPQQITIGLLPGLPKGTYTVGWHVISADSHPVQGAFTFSIGAPSSTAVNAASLGPQASKLVGFVFGVVRWLAFCCLALLIGGVAFVIFCWPGGAARPPVVRFLIGAWGGLAVATLSAILLQGVYGAGQGFGHVFVPNVLHATLHSRYGLALGARLLLVVLALVVFSVTLGSLPAAGQRSRRVAALAWAVMAVALASTWAVADHAGTGIQVPVAVPSDTIHLTAIATWIGGLAMLMTFALRRQDSAEDTRKSGRRRYQAATVETAAAISRFSPIALGCVVVIVATGTYQAWRGVGMSVGALFDTTYGLLLLAKVAAVIAVVSVANVSRRRVQRLRAPVAAIAAAQAGQVAEHAQAELVAARAASRSRNGTRSPRTGPRDGGADDAAQQHADEAVVTLRRLRWSVSAEVAIVTAVLAITAMLVNTPTARETYRPVASTATAFNTGAPGGRGAINVVVTPARLGPNQLRIVVTSSSGRPYRPQQIQAELSLPARGIGPLPAKLTAGRAGTYLSAPVVVTITGQWQLSITIRSDAFDETTVNIGVPIH